MLAAVLATLLLAAPAGAADAEKPAPRPRTVSGTVAEVSLARARLGLDAPEGRMDLSLDRNTLVLLASRQGTVADLSAGQSVRASVGPDGEAYWVEVLPKEAATPSAGAATQPGPAPSP